MLQQHDQRTVVGFDGGGTNTRSAVISADGELLGHGSGGPSNFQAVGVERARRSILDAYEAARAGMEDIPAAAFLGMAGVVSEQDRETILSIGGDLRLAAAIDADHDIRIALAGGLAGEPGIALIAGTGSSCYGRNAAGESWRSGGWGHLLDDLGSGYWLGVQGMIAATRDADGRSAGTSLTPALMAALRLERIDDLSRLVGHDGLSRADIAALAPIVIDAARNGDAVAPGILRRGADELALMVAAVARKLGMEREPRVVLIGGLLSDPLYAGMVRGAIAAHLSEAIIIEPILPPVLGAALLALRLAGIAVTSETIDLLRSGAAHLAGGSRATEVPQQTTTDIN